MLGDHFAAASPPIRLDEVVCDDLWSMWKSKEGNMPRRPTIPTSDLYRTPLAVTPGVWTVDRPYDRPGTYVIREAVEERARAGDELAAEDLTFHHANCNARLISYAPILYELLERCVALLELIDADYAGSTQRAGAMAAAVRPYLARACDIPPISEPASRDQYEKPEPFVGALLESD